MIRTITADNVGGKRVIVRCDFNVPVNKKGEVEDEYRILRTLPTLNHLIREGAKVILVTHLERRGEPVSVKPLVKVLSGLLRREVKFSPDTVGPRSSAMIGELQRGEVILLENPRFYDEEESNDPDFAREIALLGDIYVNEAFSSAHRAHASLVGVPHHLPSFAGLLLEEEVATLATLRDDSRGSFVVIIGGVKVATKVGVVNSMLERVDHILLGSKIGEVTFAHQGVLLGREFDEDMESLRDLNVTHPKIHLPLDGVIALKDLREQYIREGGIGTLRREEEVYDIGPETVRMFTDIIKSASRIVWNGPLGLYEDTRFSHGTKAIAESITRNRTALKVAGGGNTLSAIRAFGLAERFDFLSTGGGAMLAFLAGDPMPALEVLEK